MQQCPQCRFACAPSAQQCGYCGAALVLPPSGNSSPYAHAPLMSAPPPPQSVGQHNLSAIIAAHAATLTLDAPANNAPTQHVGYPTWSVPAGYVPLTARHVVGALPSSPIAGRGNRTQAARGQRWWLLIVPVSLFAAWGLTQNNATWDQALQSGARALFAGAVALGCVGMTTWLARHDWHRMLAPAICAALLLAGGTGMEVMAPQALQWQAQAAEQQGNYPHAIALFQRAGSTSGIARTELEWGQALITQNDFTDAQTQIQAALDASQGSLHTSARAAIGQLLWRWGQVMQVHGDLADTRAKWEASAALAADTPAGALATMALAVPQTVTGHVLWLGAPLPGMRVALVSSWAFTTGFHIVAVNGEQLEAISGDDGSFSIHGVRPGVTYTFIWESARGYTTNVDAQNQPLYTVTLEPLQGSDIGAIAIDAPSSVSHNSHGASGNGN